MSLRLFLIKGYERTTIQDIKEAILIAGCEKMLEYKSAEMQKLRDQSPINPCNGFMGDDWRYRPTNSVPALPPLIIS